MPQTSPLGFSDYLSQYNQRQQAFTQAGLNVGGADSLDTSLLTQQSQMNPSIMSDMSGFSPITYQGQSGYQHMANLGGNQYQKTVYDPSGNVLDQSTGAYQTPSSGGFLDVLMGDVVPAVSLLGPIAIGAGAALAGEGVAGGAATEAPAGLTATQLDLGAGGSAAFNTAGYGGGLVDSTGVVGGIGSALSTGGTPADVAAGTRLGSSLVEAPSGLTATQLDLGAGGSSFANTAGYGGDFATPAFTSGIDLGSLGSIPAGSDTFGGGAGGGITDQIWNLVKKHPQLAAQLGLSGLTALRGGGQLPGAYQQLYGQAGPAATQAQGVISSGGTAAPAWSTQKAAIDSAIDQQVKNSVEQIIQSSVNSGMGGAESAVVQQKIAQMKLNAQAQKEQLYAQQLTQNVNQAITELSQSNDILSRIGAMQYEQSQASRAAAAQTAELALMLAFM